MSSTKHKLRNILVFVALLISTVAVVARAKAAPQTCLSGAHTLSNFGDRLYPEMGNGGNKSIN